MVDRVVRVQLVGDATSLIRAANEAAAALRGIGSSSSNAGSSAASGANQAKSAWDKFKESVAGQVAIGDLISKGVEGAFGMLKDGLAHVIELGMGYEQSMNTLSAVTSANADEMAALGDRAKQLGNDITIPGASASSAAEAMAELAKGGLNVNETMTAAAGTLRLAAAAQVDGAAAAQIQANALNAFRLKADQADHVADLLANAANAASGEITDMASSLQQSATVAAGFGISIDNTTTTLALFAKNGILGSDAGTSLKTMLSALASPTQQAQAALDTLGITTYNAQGNFVGMASITDQLAMAKKRLTVEDYNQAASTAFGTDAIRAANILGAEGTKGWAKMANAVGKAGGAQELAAAQSQGLTGAMDRLWNAADNVALTLYEAVVPALQGMADFGASAFGWLGDAIGWLTDLPMPIWAGVTAFGAMILLKGPLASFALVVKGEMLALKLQMQSVQLQAAASGTSMGTMGAAMRLAGISARSFGTSLKAAFLSNPIGLAVAAVTTALSFMITASDDAATSTTGLSAAIDENTGALSDNAEAIISKAVADSGSFDAIEAIGGNVKDYTQALMGNADAQDRVHTLLLDQAEAAVKNSTEWSKMVGSGEAAEGAARKVASGLLANGDAGAYSSAQMDAVLHASANFAGESDQLSTAQRQTEQAIEAAGTAAGAAAGSVDTLAGATADAEKEATPFGDALKEIRSAASEADSAAQFLNITLLEMSGITVTADQRARANAAAYRDVAGSARDLADAHQTVADKQAELDNIAAHLGTTLNGQDVSATNLAVTQADVDRASRELADAQAAVDDATDKAADTTDKAAESARNMTAEAYNSKAAQGDFKGAVEAAVAKMAEQREAFIQSQIHAGKAREEAEKLADAQNLIPANVRTTYQQEGLPSALTEVERLRQAIADLPDSKIVKVAVESGDIVYTTESGAQFKADGGMIYGPGSGTSDNVPIMASNGEFIVRASQTAKHRGLLEQINTPGFATGGIVDTNTILTQATVGNLVDTGWQSALDKAATEKARKFAESGMFGLRQAFLNAVASKMGTSYVWGAAGPDVFDCSGLVSWALNQIGAGVGRLTAQGFNAGFPHVGMPGKPGDLATFDTGRLPGQAGHIGIIMDPAKGLMMHTDGAGPARVSDYKSRDGGPLSIVDVLSGKGGPLGNALALGLGGDPGVGPGSGSGVDRWRGIVLQALARTGQPANYADIVLNQMRTESSGNQFAINNWDSNARRGTPSKGLMQVIDPTFQSYRDPTLTNDIWLPLPNVTAAIRYVLGRYGSIPAGMQGRAYENGGVLPPGFTMAYNGTGQDEYVSTHGQFNAMAAQAVSPVNVSPVIQITNYVDAAGMVARTEVMVDGKLAEVRRVLTVSGAQT